MRFENLTLANVKYFIDTVETKSFTQAALLNHVSRPAISQAIVRLEESTGLQLFFHAKKTFELTEAGEDFYRRSKYAYEAFYKELVNGSKEKERLTVGCSTSLIDTYLLPALKKTKSKFKLQIKTGTSASLKQLIELGTINVALFIDNNSIVPGVSSEIISKGHFSLGSRSGILDKLIVTTEDRPEVIELRNAITKKNLVVDIIQTESWSIALKLANALSGACLVPHFLLNSQIVPIKFVNFRPEFKIILAYRRRELLSDAEINFCNQIKSISII
jgi:DNA-binding transcriptional LysR family regulator